MERWLNKVLNSLHLVISPRKEALANTKKIKIRAKKDSKDNEDTKAKVRVDKYPLVSYIYRK
jgi:hypothetical protein